jgi:hypothetical protein
LAADAVGLRPLPPSNAASWNADQTLQFADPPRAARCAGATRIERSFSTMGVVRKYARSPRSWGANT